MATTKPFKLPKALGACADMLYDVRQQRLTLQKEVDALAEREALIRDHLIESLPKSDASGVAGKAARAQVRVKAVPQVTDWDKFYGHIKKKGEFELLNRAVNRAAVAERWEAGKEVPGVGRFNQVSISITKL